MQKQIVVEIDNWPQSNRFGLLLFKIIISFQWKVVKFALIYIQLQKSKRFFVI